MVGGIILVIVGFGWLLFKIISEACITQVPNGTDYDKVYRDLYVRKVNPKTVDKRISNGYYKK